MPESDLDDIDFDEPEQQPKRNFRRELEDRASNAEAKAQRLERENAIFKAGLNGLSERQIRTLASEIGDNLDPQAVRQVAAELGWATDQQPTDETVPADELAALDRVANASNGSGQPTKEDPALAMERALNEGGMEALMAEADRQGLPTSWNAQ